MSMCQICYDNDRRDNLIIQQGGSKWKVCICPRCASTLTLEAIIGKAVIATPGWVESPMDEVGKATPAPQEDDA